MTCSSSPPDQAKGRPPDSHTFLWLNEVVEWGTVNGKTLPTVSDVTWFDDGKPWAVFTIEEVLYNVDMQQYVRANGL